MRRPILKNSNKKLKGNISLLVILILLASSVIGLLSINQIQRLITYWNQTFNYFRAFYLAKAWTELGLTEVYYREAGFNHSINSWDAIVSWNLNESFSGFNPHFEMTISWSFANLTNDVRFSSDCNSDNKIVLGTWEWILISLFSDNTQDLEDMFTWTTDINLTQLKNITDLKMEWLEQSGSNFTFWLFSYNENGSMVDVVVSQWNNLNDFLKGKTISQTRSYLTIKNSSNEDVSFCISSNDNQLIPSSDSLITVRGNYWDMEVWLQSIVKKWVPDWTLNVLWEWSPG